MQVSLLFVLLCAVAPSYQQTTKKIVCYFGSWSVVNDREGEPALQPDGIDPFACTHVIYAFADLRVGQGIIPANDTLDVVKGGYTKITSLKRMNPNLKVMLGVGGTKEGPLHFSRITISVTQRRAFIRSILTFLKKYDFDGIDLDWQYPGQKDGFKDDIHSYANFTIELREAFEREARATGRERMLISMVVPNVPDLIITGYKLDIISQQVDFLNLLGYDFHFADESTTNHHAPLLNFPEEELPDNNVNGVIKFLMKLNTNLSKFNLGIPAYGRLYTLEDDSETGLNAPAAGEGDGPREPGSSPYWKICQMVRDGWKVERPYPDAIGPYTYQGTSWISYDDPEMIKTKVQYVIKNRLGGIMFWSIDHMDYMGHCGMGTYPLLRAAKEACMLNWNNTLKNPVIMDPKFITPTERPGRSDPIVPPTPASAVVLTSINNNKPVNQPDAGIILTPVDVPMSELTFNPPNVNPSNVNTPNMNPPNIPFSRFPFGSIYINAANSVNFNNYNYWIHNNHYHNGSNSI